MRTKQELEQAIVMHEEALESSKHSVIVDTQDLEQAKKDLLEFEDLNNKPIISETVHGLIIDIITNTVNHLRFDADDFDYEMKMGYNNTVELDEITLKEQDSLIDDIMNGINNQFYVIEDLAEVIIDNDGHSVMGSFDENGDAE